MVQTELNLNRELLGRDLEEGKCYIRKNGTVQLFLGRGMYAHKIFYTIGALGLVEDIMEHSNVIIANESLWGIHFNEVLSKVYSGIIDQYIIENRFFADTIESGYLAKYDSLDTKQNMELYKSWINKLKLVGNEVYASLGLRN